MTEPNQENRSNDRSIDPLLPKEMALKAEEVGAAKARLDTFSLLALAVIAGADIAFGAIFMTTTVAGAAGELPFGVVRMLGGLVFSLGLILVVVGGAELFTGDNLMVMAWAGRVITLRALLRAWIWVYLGNFVGAVGTAVMAILAGWYKFGGGAVGKTALNIAQAKATLPLVEALFLGILCNVLVCLAVWLTYSARTVTGKVLVIVPPIAACQYVLPAGGTHGQGPRARHILAGNPDDARGLRRPHDHGRRPQPYPRHHRQRHRRRHLRRHHLLVRLFAKTVSSQKLRRN